VLAEWDLRHEGNDNEVSPIGIWINDVRYEKYPASPVGTLIYKLSYVLDD